MTETGFGLAIVVLTIYGVYKLASWALGGDMPTGVVTYISEPLWFYMAIFGLGSSIVEDIPALGAIAGIYLVVAFWLRAQIINQSWTTVAEGPLPKWWEFWRPLQ